VNEDLPFLGTYDWGGTADVGEEFIDWDDMFG